MGAIAEAMFQRLQNKIALDIRHRASDQRTGHLFGGEGGVGDRGHRFDEVEAVEHLWRAVRIVAIADIVPEVELREDYIIPSVFNRDVATSVANAVVQEAKDAASAGDPAKAIEAGQAIKQKGMEIATTLGLRQ